MTKHNSKEAASIQSKAIFTTGSTMRHVVSMTMAGAIGLVSIFAVDLLNLYYISKLGEHQLTAAIGYASTIMFFTMSISIGFTIAATAIVSKAIGQGESHKIRSHSGATLIYISIINIVTAIALFPLIGPALSLLGAKGQAYDVALGFMQIVMVTVPLMGLGMVSSGLLRARGDGKRSMYVTLSAGIITAIMDPILIFYFELGVQGAAISTVFSRVMMVVVGFYGIFSVHRMVCMPDWKHLKSLLGPYLYIAIPAMLTQIATPFSNAYMTAVMSEFGDSAVAGWAIIGRLVPLAFVALFTLSSAVGPILGQNLGAKFYGRINETMRNSLWFTLGYSMTVWAILIVLSQQIVGAFGLSGEAADLVEFFCLLIGGTYVFQGGLYVANAAFNNLGYPFYSTFFNWGRATAGTIPFVWYGAKWGPEGALLGFGIGGIIFGLAAVIVCFWVIRKLPQKFGPKAEQANAS